MRPLFSNTALVQGSDIEEAGGGLDDFSKKEVCYLENSACNNFSPPTSFHIAQSHTKLSIEQSTELLSCRKWQNIILILFALDSYYIN